MGAVVLVTGAAGFIGYHLCRRLLGAGYTVVGLDNMNDYYDVSLKRARLDLLVREDGFLFELCDIADQDALHAVFCRRPIEFVVNLAAQAGVRYSIDCPESYIRSNLDGFFHVLECCRAHPVKHLLFASSSSVYGNSGVAPFSTQQMTDKPVSLYAATKKANELMACAYAHLYGIASTGLRFFTVYGPYGRPDMAYFSFTQKILAGEAIKLFNDGDMYRDFTYVDDVTEAICRMLEHPPAPDEAGDAFTVYNIGNSCPERLTDFVAALEQALGVPAKREYLPMQMGDVYETCADTGPLERDFGFRPHTPMREGLQKFADWYREFYGV